MPNMARFYSAPKQNKIKSAEAGRPIFDEHEMVEINLAGDKQNRPHFPAHEVTVTYDAQTQQEDRRTWAERYPNEYRAFKTQSGPHIEGTPLVQWPILTRAQVAELGAIDIFTVEQIADMNARNRQVLGPAAHQLIAQAKAYIERAREGASDNRLASENAELKAELERMKADMEKPKRGRPAKVEEVDA